MRTNIGNNLILKWMILLTLSTVLPVILVGLSIVLISHQGLWGSFIAVNGIVLIAVIPCSFFLARKRILPFQWPGNTVGYEGFVKGISDREKIEEELRKSEERYRTILENIQDGYFEIDLAGNYTFVNDAECANMGYTKDELIGMNNRQYTDKENAEKSFQAFNELYRAGKPVKRLEMEVVRKDGTKAFNEISVSLIRDSEGKPTGFRGISRDITERKRSEEALRRSEETLKRLAQENAVIAEVGQIINSTLNIEEVYQHFAEEVRKLISFDRISINIINPERETGTVAYAVGVDVKDKRPGDIFPLKGSMTEEVMRVQSGLLVQTEDIEELKTQYPGLLTAFQAGLRSVMSIPIFSKEKVIGSLQIRSLKPNAYSETDMRLAERVSNQIAGAIANTQLLAKIKQGEELLKKEREVFFAILYNARYGILMADPDDRCLYVNPEFTNITGYTFQDVPTVPDWFNNAFLDSKYRQRAIENWKKERLRGETVDRESNIICKNGKTKRLEIRAVFLEDKNVVVAFYDVTERKRAEEALRQSEEKYRTILESIEEGYYEVDLAGNFTFLNDSMCRVFGYPREELMGMNDREYTDQGTMRKLFQAFNEVYRTGRPGKVFDNEIVRKDGTKRHVETSISLRKDASGRPIGFRGIIRDITDRKRIEEQLFQAEKLRAVGEMASGVAHDFNNTLAAILGNTQLLLYTAQDEELKETLKIIEKVAKDSSQTVRRLQDFTRKRVPQEVFKVDINAVVKDSIEITKPKWKDEAQGKGIPVEMVSHFGDIPLASGSASELREVITNMILNAIEAMPGGGRVEIRTFRKRRNVFIQILDTGVGIAEETKKRIFDPFFTTKPFTNTGLGLSMSYGIVKRFGGEIEVESNVGQGTTFTIALPMGEEQKEEPVDSPPIKKGRRARILVIDDDEFVRDVLSRTLAQADHQVTLAESGGKGVQLFKEGEFDMVLTDLGMPGVSGWEVCRMIKGMSPQTPVGMVTGWGDEKNRDKKEEYGLDFFISKPFDFAQILNVVAETMESRKE